MKLVARTAVLLVAVVGMLSVGGCSTYWRNFGGGPLTYEELGDWGGIPELRPPTDDQIAKLRDRSLWPTLPFEKGYSSSGEALALYLQFPGCPYAIPGTPARNYLVRVDYPSIKHLIPSRRFGTYLYTPRFKIGEARRYREFAGVEDDWGAGLFILDFVFRGNVANIYDVDTGERAAAESSLVIGGVGIGLTRRRMVRPVTENLKMQLGALGSSPPSSPDALYSVKDATTLFFGAIGWGRVNRDNYVQILWIPISTGRVKMPAT